MTRAGRNGEFLIYAHPHGHGFYAVRDGVTTEQPNGGPRYAHLEDEDVIGLDAKIDDFVECERMSDEDLMDAVAGEMRWDRPGFASAELDRRHSKSEAA